MAGNGCPMALDFSSLQFRRGWPVSFKCSFLNPGKKSQLRSSVHLLSNQFSKKGAPGSIKDLWMNEWYASPLAYPPSLPILFLAHLKVVLGLPWWRSGWESARQCRGHGFEPWSGKIPHAAEQLGPWATITEPAHLEPVLRNKRGRDSERPAHRDEEWPPLAATRGSPRTETKTQHSHK